MRKGTQARAKTCLYCTKVNQLLLSTIDTASVADRRGSVYGIEGRKKT